MPTGLSTRRGVSKARLSRQRIEERNHDVPVYQVATAATAADLYFPAFELGNKSYRDGGFGPENNPSEQGLEELQEEWGDRCVQTVVSIGTARGNQNQGKRRLFSHIGVYVHRWVDSFTDTLPVHQTMEKRAGREDFSYYRLNSSLSEVPNALLNMALDEWEPRRSRWRKRASGTKTLAEITMSAQKWFGEVESRKKLRDCAKELVAQRKQRASHTARWERFAHAAEYRCYLPCDERSSFNKDRFVEHTEAEHQIDREDIESQLLHSSRTRWRYRRQRET